MAYNSMVNTDVRKGVGDYISLLAKYYRTLPGQPGSSGPAFRPPGVQIRNKEPNVTAPHIPHPSGRPPAEHIVRLLAHSVVSNGVQYKPDHNVVHIHAPIIHPGKALTLRNVKAIHLGGHSMSIKKVSA